MLYIYRHPCMQQSEFSEEYPKHLSEKLISDNKKVILLGDFNIDLLKCDWNKNVFDFLDIIYSTNLLLNIKLISRSQTLINNIFSTERSRKWWLYCRQSYIPNIWPPCTIFKCTQLLNNTKFKEGHLDMKF